MVIRKYEALFIADASLSLDGNAHQAGEGSEESQAKESVESVVKSIYDKVGVDIQNTVAWGNRKFAYMIDKATRGNYFLVYFEAESAKLNELHRQINLNESIIRVMITEDPKGDKKDKFLAMLEAQSA